MDFVRSLKPAYNFPSRKAISGELLDKQYEKIQQAVDIELERSTSICLTVDAWTNCRNESVVGFTATTPKPFFLRATFPGDAPHTAEFFFRETSAIIDSVGRSKVSAIVTDNAADESDVETHRTRLSWDYLYGLRCTLVKPAPARRV